MRDFSVKVPRHLWYVGPLAPDDARVVRVAVADWHGVGSAQLVAAKAALLGGLLRRRGDTAPWPPGFVEAFRGDTYEDYVFLEGPEPRDGQTEFVLGVYDADGMHVWYARLPPRHCPIITHGQAPTIRLLRDTIMGRIAQEALAERASRLQPCIE